MAAKFAVWVAQRDLSDIRSSWSVKSSYTSPRSSATS